MVQPSIKTVVVRGLAQSSTTLFNLSPDSYSSSPHSSVSLTPPLSLLLPSRWSILNSICWLMAISLLIFTTARGADICVSPIGSPAASSSAIIPCGLTSSTTCCDTISSAMLTYANLTKIGIGVTTNWSSSFTPTTRLQLLTTNVHTIRLAAGSYGCDASGSGWLLNGPIHFNGATDSTGTPTSIIDCGGNGRIFRIRESSVWLTNLILQNGASEIGSAFYVEVGYNASSSIVDDPILFTDGSDHILFPPFGLVYDIQNVHVLNHLNQGPGAFAFRINGETSNLARIYIRGSLFQGNQGTNETVNIPDGVHAGALTITYNGGTSQNFNEHRIEDTSFLDNSGGNDFGVGAAVGAGAFAFSYSGAGIVQGNTFLCLRCTFLRNTGGSRITITAVYTNILDGFVIGGGAFVLGSGAKWAFDNSETFIDSVFIDNVGGNDCASPIGEATGAGAININYVPYSDCRMWNNSQIFTGCIFRRNHGGNNNNNAFSNYASNQGICIAGSLVGGGAGAVSVIYQADAFLSDPSTVSQDLQTLNQNQSSSLLDNNQLFTDCLFDSNTGGVNNNQYYTPCVGGGGGAGGLLIIYSTTAISGSIDGNRFESTSTTFVNNTGGNKNNGSPASGIINGGDGGGGAGGVFILFGSAVADGSINRNTQLVTNTLFLNNSGGNNNAFGNTAGSASGALTIFYFFSSSLASTSYSTFVDLTSNSINIVNTDFISNTGGKSNSENSNGGSSAGAVAITFYSYSVTHISYNHVHLTNCLFQNNGGAGTANSYGAMSGAVGITWTTSSSTSSFYNLDVALRGCTFIGNMGNTGLSGLGSLTANTGAFGFVLPYPSISALSGHNVLLVQNCTFDSQVSTSGAGMWVITTLVPFLVEVINSTFTRNAVTEDAGAIRFSDVTGVITNCTFGGNTAVSTGGAILVETHTTLKVHQSTFLENSAVQFAGEFLIRPPATVALDQCLLQMAGGYDLQPQQPGIVFASASTTASNATATTTAVTTSSTSLTWDNETIFECNPGNVVYSTLTSYGCQYCRIDTYSLSYSRWIKHSNSPTIETINPDCQTCEFGANCKLGGANIRSVVGYWGSIGSTSSSVSTTSNSQSTELSFTLCLPTYCCTVADATHDSICPTYSWCAPHRTGRLCGLCEVGYSEVVGSDECQSNDRCDNSKWFFAVAFVAGSILAVLIGLQGAVAIAQRTQDAKEHNPDSTRIASSRTPLTQSFSLWIYFFQLAGQMYIASPTTSSAGTSWLSGLFSGLRNLFEFSPSSAQSSSGGLCLWPNMTSVQKQAMYLTGPFFILIPFIIGFMILFAVRPFSSRLQQLESNSTPMYLWSILLVGLVKIGLLGFSTFIRRLLILVHCVPVPPEVGTYLLQSGDIKCFENFQIGAVICLVILTFYPILFIYWLRPRDYQLKPGWNARASMRQLANQQAPNWRLARINLVDLLTADYHPRYRYWEGAMLFYRLAVAGCSTLINQTLIQMIVLFCLNLIMFCCHITFQPFRFHAVQQVQTICLLLLTVISACSLPLALMISVAMTPPAGALGPEVLYWIQFLSLSLCMFIGFGVLIWCQRRMMQENQARAAAASIQGKPAFLSANKFDGGNGDGGSGAIGGSEIGVLSPLSPASPNSDQIEMLPLNGKEDEHFEMNGSNRITPLEFIPRSSPMNGHSSESARSTGPPTSPANLLRFHLNNRSPQKSSTHPHPQHARTTTTDEGDIHFTIHTSRVHRPQPSRHEEHPHPPLSPTV